MCWIFLGSFNVLFFVQLECIYQQMKFLNCIQLANRCTITSYKFEHPTNELLECIQLANYHGCQCHGVHSYQCSSMICNELVLNS